MAVVNRAKRRLTDKWLSGAMVPSRHQRDFYEDSEHGRLMIQMITRNRGEAYFGRQHLRPVTTQGDVMLLAAALGVEIDILKADERASE